MSSEAKVTLGSHAKAEHLCLLQNEETKAETSTLIQHPVKALEFLILPGH